MLYLNANEEKRLVFEVEIHGVETKDLHGSVRFLLHGVEYGFPADIESKKIVSLIPPLIEVVGREIEDGTIMEAKLELYTDRNYFKPWEGEIKLGAPMQIKAKLESEDKSRFGIKTKLVNPVIVEDTPPVKKEVKKETVRYDNKEQVPTNEGETLKKAVMSVMKEMGLMNPPAPVAPAQKKTKIAESVKPTQKKVIEPPPVQQVKKPDVKITETKTQQEAIHDFIQEKLMSIGKPFQPVRHAKKVVTKEDIMNVTEDQIYIYMEKAGTKNPDVQKLIYEQASQGAVSNYDILKNVVKIIKRK
jgi:hypothetical protein